MNTRILIWDRETDPLPRPFVAPRRNGLFLFFLLLFSILLCLVPEAVTARVGGGEGYSSGGGAGGSGIGSGGSGDAFILFYLVQLAFRYPAIGVPVLIVAVFFFYGGGRTAFSRHVSRTIRTGYRTHSARVAGQSQDQDDTEQLRRRDPDFSPEIFVSRCSLLFPRIQEAWSRQDMTPVRPFLSDGVFERFQIQLEMQKASYLRNVMAEVKVVESRIVRIRSDHFFDTIHLSITASAVDNLIDSRTQKRVRGKDTPETFTEVWSFLRRPGTRTLTKPGLLEGYCPNCGAVLQVSESVECPSCKSIINSGEYDWVLAEITQVEEWKDRPSRLIPGLEEMVRKDRAFNLQHVEDKASVMFWRQRAAEFFASDIYLRKLVLPSYLEERKEIFQPLQDGRHSFYADAAVGSVETMDIHLNGEEGEYDSIRVHIKWSGHREKKEIPSFLLPEYEKSQPFSQEFILLRKADVLSSDKNTLASLHCPGCGAPETKNNKGVCEYCGLAQNDGTTGWVLRELRPYSGPSLATGTSFSSRVAEELGVTASVPLLSQKDNEHLLTCAVAVMNADGNMDPQEMKRLKKMAAKRNVSDDRLNELIRSVRQEGETYIPESGPSRRNREFLRAMVVMCLSDGNISPQERRLIKTLVERMEYSDLDIDQMIKEERSRLYRESRQILKQSAVSS